MSLRLRLLLGLGLVAVVLVGVAVVVTRSTRDDLLAKVDEQLSSSAESAVTAVAMSATDGSGASQRPGSEGSLLGGRGNLRQRGPSTIWVGVTDGETVETAVSIDDSGGGEAAATETTEAEGDEGNAPTPDLTDPALAELQPGDRVTVAGVGAERFRVLAVQWNDDGVVLVGAPLDNVDSSVQQLIVVELGATFFVLALLALVALWVLRLGVQPIRRMTVTAKAIGAGDLSQRVPEADPNTEAGELGGALNSMLTRIEEAFAASAASEDRLRRFVADASHELRTPITTIRGYAELHRRGGLESPEARASAMARTEQEAVRMGRLVEDLLLLARLDQGRPLDADPVDLGALAADARDDTAVAHPDHPITLTAEPGSVVVGDDHRLRQVVANLVANAVAHTPAGTAITLRVASVGDDQVELVVADTGPGMPAELAEQAFERFARGDVARSRAEGSTGLGLSIVEAIVTAHGGTVSLESVEGSGTTVRVLLPRGGRARDATS